MYQLMFPYWADVAKNQSGSANENRFAERLTAIDKVVISRSLDKVEDNTRLVRSNPVEELFKLSSNPAEKFQ